MISGNDGIGRPDHAGLSTTGNVVQGNYIGTDVTGTLDRGNSATACDLDRRDRTTRSAARPPARGNVISGNDAEGIRITDAATTTTWSRATIIGHRRGGHRGAAATRTTASTSQATTDSNTIGGTNPGEGNVISANENGVQITGSATGNRILGNSIYANTSIGIELNNDGVNPPNGTTSGVAPNIDMDTVGAMSAVLSGTTLTVSGYVGNVPASGTFANARVEFFLSDNDPTGWGEGRVYLGHLDANASSQFSGNLTVAGVSIGDRITATATDAAGNTSEFSLNVLVTGTAGISGTVYDDVDGDANVAEGGTLAFANATVRLYDSGSVLLATTTTDAAGLYAFTGLGNGTYYVAVDSKTLAAPGYNGGFGAGDVWAEQTYGDDSTTVPLDLAARYGGRNAAVSDNAAAFATSEHLARAVVAGGTSVNGVDYGFSFSAIVNTRGDNTDDDGAANRTQQGSLRQFILNSNAISGAQTSDFSIGAAGSSQTITLSGASLPTVTDAVVLDAWTQGAAGYSGPPLIVVDGNGAVGATGLLRLSAGGSTVRGFVLQGSTSDGIRIDTAGGNTIVGNYIGTNAAGNAADANGSTGVSVMAGANGNTIGGLTAAERNVIAANGNNNIGLGSNANVVLGNYIGIGADGSTALGATSNNVYVTGSNNTIGGTAAGSRNVISASSASGVFITTGTGNVVQGNYIGTDATGMLDRGNAVRGVEVWSANGNTIGGAAAGAGNLVSGNDSDGINVNLSNNTTVQGNVVGLNAAGTAALANGRNGIRVNSANNLIGGSGAGNVVSGNSQAGVYLTGAGATGNVLLGNRIGTDAGGTLSLGNGAGNEGGGVWVGGGGTGVTIGGTGAGEGNTIATNYGHGVTLSGVNAALLQGNTITGNFDPSPAPVPNIGAGVSIESSSGVTVGGTAAGSRNVISGNQTQGVFIGFNSSNNWVAGNYLGTDATGTVAQANGHSGVLLYWNADNNTIGGTTAAARNLISGNGTGVWIEESSDNNVVSANYIGVDASGAADLGNGSAGVIVNLNSLNNRIGGTLAGERNVISGNGSTGVLIQNGADGTLVQGNYIGTNAAGSAAIQNDGGGVGINNAANVTIGGAAAGAGNLISGHTTQAGVALWGGSIGAVIQGNRIGTDATGTVALGNRNGVSFGGGSWNGLVGGTGAGEGNLIAYSTFNGVEIYAGSTGVSVLGNSIHSNGMLGINLVEAADPPTGVTANDAGDADAGANNLQNFPVLTAANVNGANITIAGTLNSAVGGSFRLEFFASAAADPSGYGEAERYLGALAVTDGGMNDADGIANGTIVFSTTLAPAIAVAGGEFVTATATALATGDTSEFSANHVANTAPVNTVPATATVNEDTAFAFTGANTISVADAQANVVQVVLTVGNGTLSAAGPGTVVGSGTASVTITGTQANINASLATLAYQGVLNYNGADTLTVVSTDAGGMTDSDGVAITVNPVNDAPTASAPASYNATEQTLLNLAGTLSVGDVDAGAGTVSVTVSVVSGQINAGAGGTGAVVAGSTTSTVTITGTLAQVANVLAGNAGATIGYFNASDVPPATDTLTLSINDGGNTGAGGALNASANSTINVAAVNDGPTATAPAAAYAATEQVSLSLASPFLTVFDVDSLGAAETVTLSVVSGTLDATAGATGVTIGGGGTGTLTFTGTIAQLNSLLTGGGGSTLTYVINSDSPPATDTLTIAINDGGNSGSGGALNASASSTINITAVNDAPVNTVPVSITVTEDVASALTGISIADADAGAGNVLVTLSVPSGTLAAVTGGGVTVGGSGTGTVTLAGTIADINAFIAASSVTFTTAANATAAVTLTVTTDDQGNSPAPAQTDVGTITLNVTPVNDEPAGANATLTVTEDSSRVFTVADFGFTDATDVPADGFLAVRIASLPLLGTLTNNAAPVNVGDFVSVADITAGLFCYTPPVNANGAGYASFDFQVQDNGGTAPGVDLDPTPNTITFDVTAVNDAPSASAPAAYAATEQVVLDLANTGLSVGDIDAGASPVTVSLSVVSGTLSATPGATGVTIGGGGTSTLTLTGSVAQINNLLLGAGGATLTYVIGSDTPPATDTLTLAIDDGGNTGAGGALNASANSTINITAVNDDPVNTVPVSITVTEDVASALTGISIADVDELGGNMLVTLAVPTGTLAAVTGGGVTVGGSGTGSLTLTGTVGSINAFIAASNVTFTTALNATAPVTLTVTTDDQGNTPAPALNDVDTVTLNVTAVNDAPVNVVPVSITVTEDVASALTGISIADVDAGAGNVLVTLSVPSGTLAAVTGGGVTVGGSGSGALTLSGTVVDINAFIAASNVTFTTALNATAPVTLTVTTDDQGNTPAPALNDVDTVTLNVTAVNDAPAGTDATVTTAEDTAYTFVAADFGFSDAADVPANAFLAVRIASLPVLGTLTNNALPVNVGDFVSVGDITAGLFRYTPPANANGVGYASFTFQVQDNGGTAPGVDLDPTPNTITFDVTAVNDAPTASAPAAYAATEQVSLDLTNTGLAVGDIDAGGAGVTVTLSVVSGTLSAGAGGTGVGIAGSGSATLTLTGTVAQINNLLLGAGGSTLDYVIASDTPPATDTLTLSINDGGNTGAGGALNASANSTINITAVNDDPVNTVPVSITVTEDVASALTGISIADVDELGGNMLVTLAVPTGTLAAVTGGGVTVGGSGSGSLTLTGTVANINAFIAASNVTFTTALNDTSAVTLTVTTDDQGNTPAPALNDVDTVTLNVTAVNDAPTASAPAAYAATEQVSLDLTNTGLAVGDIDAGGAGVTVTLGVVSGTLSAVAGTTGVGIVGSGSATLTLTGTVAQINNLLLGAGGSTLSYVIASDTPPATDTLTLSINDGGNTGAGGALNASANSTINITAVNDAPVNTVPVSITVTEDVASALTGISIADVDALGGNMLVTLSVPSGTLAAVTGGGVAVGGSGSGTLTLTGTVGNINAFIAASNVTFTTALNATAPVTLTVTTDDQGNTPAPALNDVDTVTLNVIAVNDAPVNTVPVSITVTEDVASALTGISIADVDAGAGNVLVTLSVPSGTLAAIAGGGVAVGGSGTGSLTLTGTVGNINAFIAASNVTFTTALNATAPVTLTVTTDDQGNTPAPALNDVDTVTLNVTAVNDAPTAAAPAVYAATEQTLLNLAGTGLTVGDADALGANETVTISVLSGVLNATAGATGVAVAGAGTGTLTLVGTIAQLNDLLAGNFGATLDYFNASDAPPAADTLTLSIDDGGNTGAGGALNASTSSTLNIAAVNDTPLNTVPGPQAVNEDTPLVFSVAGGNAISVADPDAATLRVTLTATNGVVTLASIAGLAFSAGDGAADATMTFTGTAATINFALDGLSFLASLDYNGPANIAITTEDLGQTGAGGPLQDADAVNITVNPVNDAPVMGARAFAVNDGQTVAIGGGNLSATDVDDAAAGLVFMVNGVTGGHFELVSAPGVAIASFTQAQILAGEVRFVHDGSNAVPNGTVSVSDGTTGTGPYALNIAFTPSGGAAVTPPGGGGGSGGGAPVAVPPPPLPPVTKVETGSPGERIGETYLRAPTSPPADGGDDGGPAEVAAPVVASAPGASQVQKVLGAEAVLPVGRSEGESVEVKPLSSEVEVEPVRAEMQILPMRRDTFDNPEDEERQRIEVVMSSVKVTGLAFSVGAVWWAARAAGLMASLLASSPAWRHVDPLPVLGRDDEEEEGEWDEDMSDDEKDRKDDEHRAAWVLEEREAS